MRCCVHAEWLVSKLMPAVADQRRAVELVCALIGSKEVWSGQT